MADAFFTRAPSTIVTIPLTGQLEFTIPFEFLARKFVVVTLLGTDRKVLTLNTDYRFIAVNKIRLERQPDGQYTRIELRRYTSATDRLVTFIDGSILRATDLNLAQVQTMHVAEEARDMTSDNIGVNDDGDLDARNRKIVNLADGENTLDAVNLGQLRQFDTSTLNNANKAALSAAEAKESEMNAAGSEARCVVAEAKAISSAGTAMTAAYDANRSKAAAKQSEDRAASILADVQAASGPSVELVAKVDKAENDAMLAKEEASSAKDIATDNQQKIVVIEQQLSYNKAFCFVNGVDDDPITSGTSYLKFSTSNKIERGVSVVDVSTFNIAVSKGNIFRFGLSISLKDRSVRQLPQFTVELWRSGTKVKESLILVAYSPINGTTSVENGYFSISGETYFSGVTQGDVVKVRVDALDSKLVTPYSCGGFSITEL